MQLLSIDQLKPFYFDALENPDDLTPLFVAADYMEEREDPRHVMLRTGLWLLRQNPTYLQLLQETLTFLSENSEVSAYLPRLGENASTAKYAWVQNFHKTTAIQPQNKRNMQTWLKATDKYGNFEFPNITNVGMFNDRARHFMNSILYNITCRYQDRFRSYTNDDSLLLPALKNLNYCKFLLILNTLHAACLIPYQVRQVFHQTIFYKLARTKYNECFTSKAFPYKQKCYGNMRFLDAIFPWLHSYSELNSSIRLTYRKRYLATKTNEDLFCRQIRIRDPLRTLYSSINSSVLVSRGQIHICMFKYLLRLQRSFDFLGLESHAQVNNVEFNPNSTIQDDFYTTSYEQNLLQVYFLPALFEFDKFIPDEYSNATHALHKFCTKETGKKKINLRRQLI